MSKQDQSRSINDKSAQESTVSMQTAPEAGQLMPGRRKLFRSVSTAGGLALSTTLMPQSWVRPVVDSVLLPAHAQTTTPEGSSDSDFVPSVSCEIRDDQNALIAEDGPVEFGTPLTITYTLSPNPGVAVAGGQRLICNNIAGPEIAIQTDVNGVYVVSLKAGSICDNQGEEAIFVDFDGATAKCSWMAFAV